MSVFVGTYSVQFLPIADTEKNEDAQRQSSTISRQIGNDGVVEHFAVETPAAKQEYKQTGKVDRCSPSELQKVEKYLWPAIGGNYLMCICIVHKQNLILHIFCCRIRSYMMYSIS